MFNLQITSPGLLASTKKILFPPPHHDEVDLDFEGENGVNLNWCSVTTHTHFSTAHAVSVIEVYKPRFKSIDNHMYMGVLYLVRSTILYFLIS